MDMNKIKESCLLNNETEASGEEPTLALAEKIVEKHPYNIEQAVAFGDKGVGKTVYGLKIGEQVYQAFEDIDEEEAWNRATASMVFNIEEFEELTRFLLESKKILPMILLDDAGVHMHSMTYHEDREAYVTIGGVLDMARTIIDGLIITTPRPDKLMGSLESGDMQKVEIIRANGKWRRIARSMREKVAPDGKKRYITTKGGIEDEYSCYLKNWKHEEYNRMRAQEGLEFLQKRSNDGEEVEAE